MVLFCCAGHSEEVREFFQLLVAGDDFVVADVSANLQEDLASGVPCELLREVVGHCEHLRLLLVTSAKAEDGCGEFLLFDRYAIHRILDGVSIEFFVCASALLLVHLSEGLLQGYDPAVVHLEDALRAVLQVVKVSVRSFGFRCEVLRGRAGFIEKQPGDGVVDRCLAGGVVAVNAGALSAVKVEFQVLDALEVVQGEFQ